MANTDLFSVTAVLTLLKFHINGISFKPIVSGFSFSIMLLKFIYIVTYIERLFFSFLFYHYTNLSSEMQNTMKQNRYKNKPLLVQSAFSLPYLSLLCRQTFWNYQPFTFFPPIHSPTHCILVSAPPHLWNKVINNSLFAISMNTSHLSFFLATFDTVEHSFFKLFWFSSFLSDLAFWASLYRHPLLDMLLT